MEPRHFQNSSPQPHIQSQSSRTHLKMRRNNQTSNFKPFQLPSQRRTNASSPSKNSSITRIINEKLIQGSQKPQYSSPSPRKPSSGLGSSAHDDDSQLDAFGESAGLSSWRVLIESRPRTTSLRGYRESGFGIWSFSIYTASSISPS